MLLQLLKSIAKRLHCTHQTCQHVHWDQIVCTFICEHCEPKIPEQVRALLTSSPNILAEVLRMCFIYPGTITCSTSSTSVNESGDLTRQHFTLQEHQKQASTFWNFESQDCSKDQLLMVNSILSVSEMDENNFCFQNSRKLLIANKICTEFCSVNKDLFM